MCVGGGGDKSLGVGIESLEYKNVAYFNIVSEFLAVIILVSALGDLGVDAGVLTTGQDAHAVEIQCTRYKHGNK